MQSVDWFPKPPAHKPGNELGSAALKCAVGLAVGALFYFRGHLILAGVAAGLALLFFAVSLSPAGRKAVGKVFGFVGEWAGRIVGSVLLGSIFVLVLTPVRFLRRVAGIDDLRIADNNERSYWVPCDPEEHKRRYAGAMFATEVQQQTGGRRGVLLLVALAVIFIAGEIGLRIQGYGHPLTYVSDPHAGYLPGPNQSTSWQGVHLATNRFGMRAPERDTAKANGVLRVLELGTDGGLHVDDDALFARLVERRLELEKAAGPGTAQVWNADVQGWGPASALGFVEAFGTFDADIAVLTLVPGALEQPLQSVLQTPFAPAERPPRLALEEKLLSALWQYRADRTVDDATFTATMRRQGQDAALRLIRALTGRGLEVLVVVVPPRGEEGIPDFALPFKSEERTQVCLLPPEAARDALDPDTGSLTAAAHAAIADLLVAKLVNGSPRARAWLGNRAP